MEIKAVIFDFDDTLVQTKTIRYEALKYTGLKFYNLKITNTDIDLYWGKPFAEMMEGVFKGVESTGQIIINYKSILHLYPNKPFDDTVSTLKILHQKYLLGLISSSVKDLIKSGLGNVNIPADIFAYIQTSDEVTFHKPDPRVFNPIKEYLHSNNIIDKEVLYVGDTIDDFVSSTKTGFNFLGIANRTTDEKIFKDHKTNYILNLSEIIAFINEH